MPSKTNGIGVQVEDTRICVVMVGLPARGKSYIAQRGKSMPQETLLTETLLTSSSTKIPTMAIYPGTNF